MRVNPSSSGDKAETRQESKKHIVFYKNLKLPFLSLYFASKELSRHFSKWSILFFFVVVKHLLINQALKHS